MDRKDKRFVPILWNHDSNSKPLGFLTPKGIDVLMDIITSNEDIKIACDCGYIIKKMRKPTKAEEKENPGLKRIIEDIELLECSFMLKQEDAE